MPGLHFWFASETGTAESMAWDAYYRLLETKYVEELKAGGAKTSK